MGETATIKYRIVFSFIKDCIQYLSSKNINTDNFTYDFFKHREDRTWGGQHYLGAHGLIWTGNFLNGWAQCQILSW